jgi:dipeptidyl aminopeptidase/acylaminoacyl peptidase
LAGTYRILVENVSFESEGYTLLGRIYRPDEPGKFPTIALCHGFPGDNKNTDLAEELAIKGYVVLIFFYRGAWGSQGVYSLKWLDPSTRDAVEYLASLPFTDAGRLGLIGYSMGAVPVSARLKADPRLKTGVFIAPAADFEPLAAEEVLETTIPMLLKTCNGKLNGVDKVSIRSDLIWILENSNPVENIKDVVRPTMVVVGTNDKTAPSMLCRLLYEAANEPKEWVIIEGADHDFSEHRYPMMDAVLEWLRENL